MATWEPKPRGESGLEQVARAIAEADDWLIVTHERPDGDAIGSALAMAHILRGLGKRWTFVVGERLPVRFSYLPLFASAVVAPDGQRTFEHVIALDCADPGRFEAVRAYLHPEARIVNIDHHRTNPRYGVAAWVDERAAATCELVYHVAHKLGLPMAADLATCLYTGLLTDTGGFVQPNTSREVHQIAAELIAAGVRPYDVAERALESRTRQQMELLKMALANLSVSEDGLVASLFVTRQMLESAGADEDDVEGLVTFARSIDTVEVGLLFRETPDGRVKVSLRSKRKVDVSRVAQQFGGGGHERASGCTLEGPLNTAMTAVMREVKAALAGDRP
jgi:phosphoesterase RecJ-like protein